MIDERLLIANKDNLVGLSNSILKHFGAETFHKGIESIDELLKSKDKIALFLFDGMGEYVLEKNKEVSSWMEEHKIATIYSVNPPTTAAATTSLLSGKYPLETGWVGWSLYDKEEGCPIEILTGRNFVTGENLSSKNRGKTILPYVNIIELINKAGKKAKIISNFDGEYAGMLKLEGLSEAASSFFASGGDFAYVYWNDPDATMHGYGVNNEYVKSCIGKCREQVEKFASMNEDVLVLVIADHGMIDVSYCDLSSYPKIDECLACCPFLDARCPSFLIKEGKEKQFKEEFEKVFGEETILLAKEEILSSGFFGEGEINDKLYEMLGQYVALVKSDKCFYSSNHPSSVGILKGNHAGTDERERRITVSAYNI